MDLEALGLSLYSLLLKSGPRDDQFANLSPPFQKAMPLDTQPSGVLSSPNSISNFSQLALSSDLAAASFSSGI